MNKEYNLHNQISFSLLKGRLGVYDKNTFNPNINSIEGVEH
jgi:hypothetical protein